MKISIVIPVFNKYKFTENCLKDLAHLTDVEVIVIDNGSSDETHEKLKDNTNIKYHKSDKNGGFAYACNIGYSLATSDKVCFLNNDIAVRNDKDNWIDIIVKACDNDALVGPTMGQLDSNLSFVKEADGFLPGLSYMSGWCLAAKKDVWQKLDLGANKENPAAGHQIFSEKYFVYFEDTDLSFRARLLEIPFIVTAIPVVHFKKQSSAQLNTAQLYLNARDRFKSNWKNKIKLLKVD